MENRDTSCICLAAESAAAVDVTVPAGLVTRCACCSVNAEVDACETSGGGAGGLGVVDELKKLDVRRIG